jgi:hypothetical protein
MQKSRKNKNKLPGKSICQSISYLLKRTKLTWYWLGRIFKNKSSKSEPEGGTQCQL